MDDLFPAGRYFRSLLTNDDLTTAAPFVYKDENGATITLVQGDRLVITDWVMLQGATQRTFKFFQDTNGNGSLDAGEEILRVAAIGARNFLTPPTFPVPIVLAPRGAGNVNQLMVVGTGASLAAVIALTGYILP